MAEVATEEAVVVAAEEVALAVAVEASTWDLPRLLCQSLLSRTHVRAKSSASLKESVFHYSQE